MFQNTSINKSDFGSVGKADTEYRDEITRLFMDIADVSRDGRLDGHELEELLKQINPDLSPENAAYFTTEILRADNDGHINFQG